VFSEDTAGQPLYRSGARIARERHFRSLWAATRKGGSIIITESRDFDQSMYDITNHEGCTRSRRLNNDSRAALYERGIIMSNDAWIEYGVTIMSGEMIGDSTVRLLEQKPSLPSTWRHVRLLRVIPLEQFKTL
jgi:hypothetical protein